MSARMSIVRSGVIAMAAALGLAAGASALAAPHGGGGGGRAVGGFHGGYAGGYRGGYAGGYRGWGGRGYYGWRGGYYGGYRGWGWGGWGCCGWGWGGVALGWYLPLLPLGYATYWWGGVPYYYANNYYYVWDGDVGQYEAVQPPAGISSTPPPSAATAAGTYSTAPASNSWTDLYAYPKGGQSTEQQQRDRDECHKWAVGQTGFDPSQPTHDNPSDWGAKRQSYLRAEEACLTARNYSVK